MRKRITKMAGNLNAEKENEQFAQFESVKLTEDDIPGASLGNQDQKQLTVKQLKFWLSCRGARTSGKKMIWLQESKTTTKYLNCVTKL